MKDTGTELVAEIDGVEVLRYVYLPDMPATESPKPYFHPLRTLSGNLVTCYRPHDHRWHKGLQLTASHVSGQNFWGGGTYVHGSGYVDLPNNGTMRHEEWLSPGVERLTWWTRDGEHWVDEIRTFAVSSDQDAWTLDFASALTNVRGEDLLFGSPTTHGRPMAGYTGLFWRGPRSFTGGEVISPGGEDMMGKTAPWLAFVGKHDEVDSSSTLLFRSADPGQAWFVRSEPFAAVNPSIAFSDEVRLAPGDTMELSYSVVIADGAWERDRLETYVKAHP